MSIILIYILFFSFIGSVASLVGGIILLSNKNFASKISHFLSAFAAGALLGTAFFDLLPESIEVAAGVDVFLWVLLGIIAFFVFERALHWFHHHHREHPEDKTEKPTVPLLVFGDSIHNLVDGVVIASTFMVSIPLGIVTSFAVAAHEIPQEIGDFGVMLSRGVSRRKVFFYNLLSALAAIVGALATYFIGESIEGLLPIVLSLTAGFFIYIAASDLIPEIHHKNAQSLAVVESALLILGVITIKIFVLLFD